MNYKPPILVCDDEPHTLHVVGSYLRRAGLGVTLTANAEQALRAAAASWPGLCILEHNSTGTNGIELCRRLREMPGLATVPVIVLTARNGRLPEMTVSSATPTAVMGKPFSPRALVEQTQDLLRPIVLKEAV